MPLHYRFFFPAEIIPPLHKTVMNVSRSGFAFRGIGGAAAVSGLYG
ncbi:MAG: hypothetical protein K2I05_02325 [Mailhella sp.]|nr:hypothetical protein [Mailhella sp.]